ncbi:MAG: hypothetical protein COA30_00490 [Sulfurimonas sp.]|nr:MAG: hypothetical protein COA30_00490 [Sulfurimonas sp.]
MSEKIGTTPESVELKDTDIIAKNLVYPTMNKVFEQWEDRLIPVQITRDEGGKKQTYFEAWGNGQEYYDFSGDFDKKNSIAMRTGDGIGVIDVDTKDLSQLNDTWRLWVEERLDKHDTLIVETFNGYHIYINLKDFKMKSVVKEGKDKAAVPFIDFRGEGGAIFIASLADKVSYEVLSNRELLKVSEELMEQLPEKQDVTSKSDDMDITIADTRNLMNYDDVKSHLHLISADVDRTTWLETMASAYNLIDDMSKVESLLRDWSKKDYSEFDEDKFIKQYQQIPNRTYGRNIDGSKLIRMALDSKVKKTIEKIERSSTIEDMESFLTTKTWLSVPLVYEKSSIDKIADTYLNKAKQLGKLFTEEEVIRKIKSSSVVDADMVGAKLTSDIAKKIFEINISDSGFKPMTIEGIEKPLIFKGGLHTIFGVYGSNKSAIAARLAGDVGKAYNMDVFYLDGEINLGAIRDICNENGVHYIPSDLSGGKLDLLFKYNFDCSNSILVLDSFTKMLGEDKSNNDAKDSVQTMERAFKASTVLGATVIVIEHGTPEKYNNGIPQASSAKMEGSQSGKLKDVRMAYKTIPASENYTDGTYLQVVKSRERKYLKINDKIFIPYEGKDGFDEVEDEKF